MTNYFQEIETLRSFQTVNEYPSRYFIEIEITDSLLTSKGWNEKYTEPIFPLTELTFRTGDSKQYWVIHTDTIRHKIRVEMFENHQLLWEESFQSISADSSYNISHIDDLINTNCLEGAYLDLHTNETTQIANKKIDDLQYAVVSDYDDIEGEFNLLSIESESLMDASWEWRGDTLDIFELEPFLENDYFTYRKVRKIKELVLLEFHKNRDSLH